MGGDQYEADSQSGGEGGPPEAVLDPATVLVVDDEAIVRADVARILSRAGFAVSVADSGRAALRLVAEGRIRPAVVVTDIERPEMSGVELAARLLAIRPTVRIVMMTRDPERAASARNHPSIIDVVLLKPIHADELIEAVRLPGSRIPAGG
jgi:CheY-like chemotaxis protein